MGVSFLPPSFVSPPINLAYHLLHHQACHPDLTFGHLQGLAFDLEYVDKFYEGDHIFESQGVHVYVDTKSMAYITGLEMDWVRNGLNEGFEFRNPNERDRCGCGESFRV